ncbi:MAG: AMP-binding protein [Deltaproteobacteria bacterium]|nr:AMP-binding protein [Deltaproteobacteria bacterium]
MNTCDNKQNTGVNVALYLRKMAHDRPYHKAVICPAGRDKNGRVAYTHLTFRQLDRESDCMAHGLEQAGIQRGIRTVLMVKPGIEFFCLIFALFKTGAVPVVVDPGMGISRMVSCFKECSPEAFIGIPIAHILRKIYPDCFKAVKIWITVGRRWCWGSFNLKNISVEPWQPFEIKKTGQDEIAAILFTTGSTGPAKGVVYSHGTFDAQVRHIKAHFQITSDEVDLPTFPLFALFDPAFGITAVIPDMDPTKPAFVNPEKIVEAITNHGVTNMFASPALLNRVGIYIKKKGIKLPSLKRVVSAGAPVAPENSGRFASMLCNGAQIHTPYGATEAMPVASIGSNEVLSETAVLSKAGHGICVGRPVGGIEVKIIKITDGPVEQWSDDLIITNGGIGEITVKGDIVTKHYYRRPEAESNAKIHHNGATWHRMGDLGRIDGKRRIWFYGRKNHRVVTKKETLFTIPCEALFNNHKRVFRSALVGAGTRPNQEPVICIELHKGESRKDLNLLEKELLAIAAGNELTKNIKTILFKKTFPVDIRHNSKIFREKLAQWVNRGGIFFIFFYFV